MGTTRRIAERMIPERAARAHIIAQKLRNLAEQLDGYEPGSAKSVRLEDAARKLRDSANQVEKL